MTLMPDAIWKSNKFRITINYHFTVLFLILAVVAALDLRVVERGCTIIIVDRKLFLYHSNISTVIRVDLPLATEAG